MEKIYCGKGKERNTQYGTILGLNICLDDIPAEHVTTWKNGKRYVRLTAMLMRRVDDRGNTHTVVVDTWKPDKEKSKVAGPEDFQDDIPF